MRSSSPRSPPSAASPCCESGNAWKRGRLQVRAAAVAIAALAVADAWHVRLEAAHLANVDHAISLPHLDRVATLVALAVGHLSDFTSWGALWALALGAALATAISPRGHDRGALADDARRGRRTGGARGAPRHARSGDVLRHRRHLVEPHRHAAHAAGRAPRRRLAPGVEGRRQSSTGVNTTRLRPPAPSTGNEEDSSCNLPIVGCRGVFRLPPCSFLPITFPYILGVDVAVHRRGSRRRLSPASRPAIA